MEDNETWVKDRRKAIRVLQVKMQIAIGKVNNHIVVIRSQKYGFREK